MYNVGQILYTVLTDKQVVIPVKIVEQVIVKTLEGADLVGSNGSIGFGFEKCRIARK